MAIILHKAKHFPRKGAPQKEESPVTSIQQLTKQIEDTVDSRLYTILKELFTKWLGKTLSKAESVFKLDGRIFINPKTGKALTVAQWKAIDKELTKVLKWAFGDIPDLISRKAIALGKILAAMPETADLDAMPISSSLVEDPYLANSVAFAEQSAAEYITSVSSTLRKDIKTAIIEALKNKWSTKQLEDVLFDKFATRNRDFRMIAETELNTNAVNGYLLTQLQAANGKTVFVKGMSNTNACPFCKANINEKVFVLLPSAPSDGLQQQVVDGKNYNAIWPGKNNIGRARADWWSAVPAHPHCACWYTVIDPAFSKYRQQLADRLQQMREQGIKLPPLHKAKGDHYYTDSLGRTWFWNRALKKYIYQKRAKKQLAETRQSGVREIHIDDLLTDHRFKRFVSSVMKYNGEGVDVPHALNLLRDDKVKVARIIRAYKTERNTESAFDQFEADVLALYDTVTTTPIRVLFHSTQPAVFDGLLSKGRYENLFTISQEEQNVTVGSGSKNVHARDSWEEVITGHTVQGLPSVFRPSYGVVPFYDGQDVSSQYSAYGSASLVLNDDVRRRTTYCLGDSSLMMGSFVASNPAQLFVRTDKISWTLPFLKQVTDETDQLHRNDPMMYIEAQIWGGVDLRRDVKEIRVGLVALHGMTPLNALVSIQHLIQLGTKYHLPVLVEYRGEGIADLKSIYATHIAPLLPKKQVVTAADYVDVQHALKMFIKTMLQSRSKGEVEL